MSSFIVIGTHNRLVGLVDGIEKCRPLNHAIPVSISTGKIEKKEDGSFIYTYTVKDKKNNDPTSFYTLLSNQIAAFRTQTGNKDNLNVFLLENPLSEEDNEELELWLKDIEKVHSQDPSLYFYNVLFTYDLEDPCNVVKRIPCTVLSPYLACMEALSQKINLQTLLFGNKDINGGAVSLDKEEHDFKLPRIMADFMMLLSDAGNRYNLSQAIQSDKNCFTIGYAESMYYYPDVKRYYEHADRRSLYDSILNDADEASDVEDSKAMDMARYPIGLIQRQKRLEAKYGDVPFDKRIADFENSADYAIDDCLCKLKDLLQKKHEEDEQAQSQPVCPAFISREEIYDNAKGMDNEEERKSYLEQSKADYNRLVEYAKSKAFFDYAKNLMEEAKKTISAPVTPAQTGKDTCFLSSITSLFKKTKTKDDVATPVTTLPKPDEKIIVIKSLREQWELKERYRKLCTDIDEIKKELKSEEEYCKDFKLKVHTQHYYPLIDLAKLKAYQKQGYVGRYQSIKTKRAANDGKTFENLKELSDKETAEHIRKFEYIDWSAPFAFVSDLNNDGTLANICDQLYQKSSPFIHYSKTTAQAVNQITLAVYSDIPGFSNRFNGIRNMVNQGNNILPYNSEHIASKICFFQFLPLNDVDLKAFKENGEEDQD